METAEVSNETTTEATELPDTEEVTAEETAEVSAESDPESTEESTEDSEEHTEESNPEPAGETDNLVELTINGEKVARPLEDVIRMAQKGVGAELKFNEAAEARKDIARMFEKLKAEQERMVKNPWEVLKEKGIDPEQAATDYLYEKIQEKNMTPEQIEAKKIRDELNLYKNKELTQKQMEEAANKEAEIAKEMQILDQELTAAIENSPIAKTELNIKNMARYMAEGEERGIPISAVEAAKMVEEDEREAFEQKFGGDGEKIFNMLGEKRFREANKYYLNKLKAGNDGEVEKFEVNTPKTKKAPKGITWDQMMKEIKGIT